MINITIARKPLDGTVASNSIKYGTGGINIDASRIGHESTLRNSNEGTNGDGWRMGTTPHVNGSDAGRWPANLILQHRTESWECEEGCPVAAIDAQSGVVATGSWNRQKDTAHPFGNAKDTPYDTWKTVTESPGGASRYFKQVK